MHEGEPHGQIETGGRLRRYMFGLSRGLMVCASPCFPHAHACPSLLIRPRDRDGRAGERASVQD